MARCLVLGANGFIGSHLVDELVNQGMNVRAFDRFGSRANNFLPNENIEIFPGDFLNRADLNEALKEVDYVFHLVSTTTPATAENDPLIDIETNIRMSVELFEECVSAKVKKVIFASTGGAIYGDTMEDHAISEEVNPKPVSPYAIGKLTIEHYLRYFNKKHALPILTFRISNPYGERHSPAHRQGVIPIFLHHIANNEPITLLGDGSMVRDYLYVKDVASLMSKSFQSSKESLYNLGSGEGVDLNQLIEIIKQVTGKPVTINHQPKPATFVQKVVLDTSLFKDEFQLTPQTPLKEGILKTWEYVLNTQHPQ